METESTKCFSFESFAKECSCTLEGNMLDLEISGEVIRFFDNKSKGELSFSLKITASSKEAIYLQEKILSGKPIEIIFR